ncbi:MAG: ATP-binding protein [Patescibacteria group bacterium]|nr:ATP-binding protein [Patescibacteria group bacterium]
MIEIFKKLEKYNYWQKKKIKIGSVRNVYLSRVEKYFGNKLIKVLVGQRRVGKSYLLRQIIQKLIQKKINPKNIFYLNKELVDFDEIRNYKDLQKLIECYKKRIKPKGKLYILLDEIQEIEQWEKIVNSFSQDYKEEYEIFLTGSNSKLLSGELATYLSGRYVSFEVLPFSFKEYIKYFNIPKDKNSFLEYLKTGGLPELYKLKEEETKIHYLSSLRDAIILKDIVARYKIKDVYLLEKIFKFMTDNIGCLFSINKIAHYLNSQKIKTNFETVSNYINYLQQAFLIYEAECFDMKGKTILSGSKKYYLNDLSFRNYLSSSFDYGLGRHLENIVYLHYRSLGYKIYVGRIGKAEIDFIIEKEKEKKYIQVAYSLSNKKVIEREFGNLEKIRDAYEKTVISMDDVSLGNKNGIKHLQAWEM